MADKTKNFVPTTMCRELLKRKNKQTPDFLDLKADNFQLVFVYDDLKTNGSSHDLIRDFGGIYFGQAHTITDNYLMELAVPDTKNEFIPFPVAYRLNRKVSHSAHLDGEVFGMSALGIAELDHIYHNNSVMTREKRWFVLTEQKYPIVTGSAFPSLPAWVYLGNEDFWANRVTKSMYQYGNQRKYFDFDISEVFAMNLDK